MIRAVMDTAPNLIDRLRASARVWTTRHEATFARLGREVVNDGGFFARIESPGASTTTATLERFARFFSDPVNWPDGLVPAEVCDFLHVVGITPAAAAPATGQNSELSGGVAA